MGMGSLPQSSAASSGGGGWKSRDAPHLFSSRIWFCCQMVAIQHASMALALGAASTVRLTVHP